MRLEDYERKVFEECLGLYSRGETNQIPEDHFSDVLNVDYDVGEWKTRAGLTLAIPLGYGNGDGKVVRFASFADPNLGPIVLILDDSGNLYTYSIRADDTATTPRLTVAGATDFSAIKILGKIYISFTNGQFGLSGQNLKIFIPGAHPSLDEFRDAAGLAPISASSMIAVDGVAGIVNAGDYKIAVAYITTSGFITQPGPKITGTFSPTAYTSPGSLKIDLSNIPIGPSGTVSRQILITKANLEEYFFLPSNFGGLINDNTTTTATLNFDDTTDLIDSADYLFDMLETIPAPLALHDYNERLVTGGEAENASILRVSLSGEPEAFDAIDGVVNINKDDGFTIRNIFQMRNVLYTWKNLGVYAVTDNGNVPSEWPKPVPVDEVVNVGIHGIAEFYDISSVRVARDWTLVADKSGILLFDGIVRKPAITDKINNIWKTLNFSVFHKIVLVVDEQSHKVYCSIPVNGASNNNKLLVGDYDTCPGNIPEAKKIKWSIWEFKTSGTTRNPTEIGLFGFPPDIVPTFKIGSINGGGKIWSLDPSVNNDDGNDIESYFQTALLHWEPGFVHNFNAARIRILGIGTLLGTIERGVCNTTDGDIIQISSVPSISLTATDFRLHTDIPRGSINGVNTTFILNYTPPIGSFIIGFQNGLIIKEGTDFTRSGGIITMTVAPSTNDSLQFLYMLGTVSTTFVVETPTGSINGINTVFTMSATPTDGTVMVWQNGLLIKNGTDFIVSTNTVVFTTAPLVGDTIQVMFHSNSAATGFQSESAIEAIDGNNFGFNLTFSPRDGSVAVFQNGLALRRGIDFTLIGGTVLLSTIPQIGDTIQFLYRVNISQVIGCEKLIRFNFQSERASLKFRLTSGRFAISKTEYFGKPVYSMRPA